MKKPGTRTRLEASATHWKNILARNILQIHPPSSWIVIQKNRDCPSCRHMSRQPEPPPSREILDEQCAPTSSPSHNISHPRVTSQKYTQREE
ncbi:hypothetical protein K439DRAFT_1636704, partial [Ramaria rubella]